MTDMFNLNTFDNTNDFAGLSNSPIAILNNIKLLLPANQSGATNQSDSPGKQLTVGEKIIANAKQGKPSATLTEALPAPIQNALSWADPARWATVMLGLAFLVIAAAAIAFGQPGQRLGALVPQKFAWRMG